MSDPNIWTMLGILFLAYGCLSGTVVILAMVFSKWNFRAAKEAWLRRVHGNDGDTDRVCKVGLSTDYSQHLSGTRGSNRDTPSDS